MFLSAILLLSMGWCTVRRSLTFREARVFILCMSIYGTLSGLSASCFSDDDQCVAFSLAETISRAIVELVVIVATNFNMSNLRARVCERTWGVEAIRGYAHLKQLSSLRRVFFAYILFPTAVSIIDLSILRWEFRWLRLTIEYLTLMILITALGVTFRPTPFEQELQTLAHMGAPRPRTRNADGDQEPLVNSEEAR